MIFNNHIKYCDSDSYIGNNFYIIWYLWYQSNFNALQILFVLIEHVYTYMCVLLYVGIKS